VTHIGVISDTHGTLPAAVLTLFADVEHILHAGDIGDPGILADLETIAPVLAVWGNTDGMDIRARVPEYGRLDVRDTRITVLHGHQVGSPNPKTLAPKAEGDVVVFGHSHRPLVQRVGSRLYLNPGSAGAPRFGLAASVAILAIGEVQDAHIITL
jgi:putative phosphoesterase